MPRLQIKLTDIQNSPLESMITIRSDKNLLVPGELRTDQTLIGNTNIPRTKLIKKNNFYITTTG